ncbi:hypothetical protein L5515_016661 [Caenorhabditis briggsae]|uniref:Uncharacterized protein n=2 Tax=Caenorhabditis briggsae TaxID=6238 RepID=A0AAE9FDH9_CAEBR|nr:hypothetical protein L5515_016661 [Caenorhabditis briggsae]
MNTRWSSLFQIISWVMTEKILFYVYRDSGTSSESLIRSLVEELKNFVFSGRGISFTSKGYSGIPLLGELQIDSPEDDIWKVLAVLFKISAIEEGLIFKVHTEDYDRNPLVVEARKSDVLPDWAKTTKIFAENVFGMNGVIHLISPTVTEKFPKRSQVDTLRAVPNKTRNILVTESLSEKLNSAASRNFGMHNTSINVPASMAYVARQRPDILSLAIREFIGLDENKIKELEKRLADEQDRVMIHTSINDTDWKEVTAVADIESPTDIVSHRVSLALLAFDEKHASIPNGVAVPVSGLFQKVGDRFEREHLESLRAQFFGAPQSATHLYQTAKALVTGNHIQECRKIFVDEGSTSNRESDCSANEEDNSNVKYAKKQVFKKKKRSGNYGKKRELAAIIDHSIAPELPNEPEYQPPDNSAFLKKFERAVNGDDYYKASSDEYSLGEEEDLDLFMAKPRKKVLEEMKNKNKIKLGIKVAEKLPTVTDDEEIDVADMLRAAPPIADAEDFEDFDDI